MLGKGAVAPKTNMENNVKCGNQILVRIKGGAQTNYHAWKEAATMRLQKLFPEVYTEFLVAVPEETEEEIHARLLEGLNILPLFIHSVK